MARAIELDSCSKRFGERLALRRFSLAVAAGESVALTGPNGSGKSTILRLVAGLTRPTAGHVTIDGVSSSDLDPGVRQSIAFVGHRPMLYRGLTAAENLRVVTSLRRLPDSAVAEALATVGLADRADDRVDGFSRGMMQRLALARLVAGPADILLLDEPSTGLDAEGKALLAGILGRRRGSATMLISTHDDAEAAGLADRVVPIRAPGHAA